MAEKISVVINTLNEADVLPRCLESVKWADEILVCDMHSDDESAVVAKKMGAKVIFHKRLNYVEPARNFAVSKAEGDWVLVVDPDEEVPDSLANKLREVAGNGGVVTYVEIPRRNLIFGKWCKASMWWPDYNIRFFKKGHVEWSEQIHVQPKTEGQGLKLIANEEMAIIHYHYVSIEQFLTRMNRYSDVQAKNLIKSGYLFDWRDLIGKPLGEFLGRFFANKGFEDGLHGLALSMLQAFSHLVVYLNVWQAEGFKQESLSFNEVVDEGKRAGKELNYWYKYGNLSKNPIRRLMQKVKNKVS